MDRPEEFLVLFAPFKKNSLGRDTDSAAHKDKLEMKAEVT
jgi:hypothetical protein